MVYIVCTNVEASCKCEIRASDDKTGTAWRISFAVAIPNWVRKFVVGRMLSCFLCTIPGKRRGTSDSIDSTTVEYNSFPRKRFHHHSAISLTVSFD